MEAKRDEINLFLPTLLPSLGLATVIRKEDTYVMKIGDAEISPSKLWGFWDCNGPHGEAWLARINEAVLKAVPEGVRERLGQQLQG
ncbi:MAG: hypothetical protein ACHQRJ_25380 [Alphaproteobacteria bacterium]|nr:hypothetical protein [Alphaproteobacteria bacterium]